MPVRYARSADGHVVTRAMVKAVPLGASQAQVRAILGDPEKLDQPLYPGGRTLTYGGFTPLSGSYTVLWVHLTDADTVTEVYSKLYRTWSPDDEPVAFGRSVDRVWEGGVFQEAFPEAAP
jgi:hypothetical protein